jgi:hypothetical protein
LDIKNNGHQLRTLAENSIATNDAMTTMTADIHSDSKFIKVLTFITVLYTPASLIAVSQLQFPRYLLYDINRGKTVFSSNLVQNVGTNGVYESTHLVLSRDFWKFPVFTICLLIATIFFAFGLRRFWSILYKRLAILGALP